MCISCITVNKTIILGGLTMFDDIFGGMFDFDGDGHTDFMEEATGFAVMEELTTDDDTDSFDLDSLEDF